MRRSGDVVLPATAEQNTLPNSQSLGNAYSSNAKRNTPSAMAPATVPR
jgi:hypothetical protein